MTIDERLENSPAGGCPILRAQCEGWDRAAAVLSALKARNIPA
jgi:hypothetical protein